MAARMVLLNPGPVTLSEPVRAALGRADCCHREPEFAALTQSLHRRLLDVYAETRPSYAAVTLAGSGTAAVEAMLRSFTYPGKRALVAVNGIYGERMAAILEAAGRPCVQAGGDWMDDVDTAAVEACLRAHPDIDAVIAVHHETTTGRLNDIGSLAELCKEYRKDLLLDAVSSFGAEEIRFADWNLRALASTANKCLHGVPGQAFVIARKTDFARSEGQAGSVYFDLGRYYRTQCADGYSPFTPAVQSAYALDAALDELHQAGGWPARRGRYRALASRIVTTLEACGVAPLLQPQARAASLTAFELPPSHGYDELHRNLKHDGFVVYAGQGPLAGRVFRIATMGDIRDEDVDRLCEALRFRLGGAR